MTQYLLIWLLCAVTLAVAVAGLHVAYRLLGSDFGTEGLVKETVTLLVASALQAGVFYIAWAVYDPESPQRLWTFVRIFGVLVVVLVYKLTHLTDMDAVELILLAAAQGMLLIVWILAT